MAFGCQPSSKIASSKESRFAQWHSPFPGQPTSGDLSVGGIKAWCLTSIQDNSQGLSQLRALCGGSASLRCDRITAPLFLLPKPVCFPPQALLIPGTLLDNHPARLAPSQNQPPGGHSLGWREGSTGQKYILIIF